MRISKAKLTALSTADGMFNIEDNVRIGKEYLVDLDTIRTSKIYNMIHNKHFTAEVVFIVDEIYQHDGFFPTELLLIEGRIN